MSLSIYVSGLNDTASLLPAFAPTNEYGFPVDDLYGLYLFEDGAIASVPTQATDSSGLGHHAAMAAASAVVRITEGVKTGDVGNFGFLADTGYLGSSDFTVFGVTRNRLGGGQTGEYPVLMTTTGNGPTSTMAANVASLNVATRGQLVVNHDSVSADSGGTAGAEVGLLNNTTASAGWAGGSNRRVSRNAAAAKASWIAWALSVNHTTGAALFKAIGTAVTVTSISDMATWAASGIGNIKLGMGHYAASSDGALGDVGLMGLYSAALSEGQIDTIIAASKTRMALRGVSTVL